MPRDLLHLVRASGYSGVAGQNMLYHVNGAEPGAEAIDYHVDAWAFHAVGDPLTEFPEEDPTDYPSGQVFTAEFRFTEASRAFHIKRFGTAAVDHAFFDEGIGAALAAIGINVIGVNDNTITFTINGSYNPAAAITSINSQFAAGEYSPEAPDSDPHLVEFRADTSSGPGSGTQAHTLSLEYWPDIGPFNDVLLKQFTRNIATRTRPISEFEIEWSSSPTGPENLGTGRFLEVMQSFGGESITVYYRWRVTGGSTWSAWASATFTDPRFP